MHGRGVATAGDVLAVSPTAGRPPLRPSAHYVASVDTRLFFGGEPTLWVRITMALVGVLSLIIGIWNWAYFDDFLYSGFDWSLWVQVLSFIAVGAAALAQAIAPVRFLWPGLILAAGAVLPVGLSSLVSVIDVLGWDGLDATSLWLGYLLPFLYSAAVVAALVVWHLQPARDREPVLAAG